MGLIILMCILINSRARIGDNWNARDTIKAWERGYIGHNMLTSSLARYRLRGVHGARHHIQHDRTSPARVVPSTPKELLNLLSIDEHG